MLLAQCFQLRLQLDRLVLLLVPCRKRKKMTRAVCNVHAGPSFAFKHPPALGSPASHACVASSQLRGISDRTLEWRNHLSNVLEVLRQSIGASTLGVGLVAALNMWIVQHAIPSDSPWLQWLDESKVVVTVLGEFRCRVYSCFAPTTPVIRPLGQSPIET